MRWLLPLLLLLMCWVTPAQARPLFKIEVEPYTEVQVFPRVKERITTFVVRGCESDLRAELGGRSAAGIRTIDVMAIGGGAWIVTAELFKSKHDLEITVEDAHLLIGLIDRKADVIPVAKTPPSLAQLFSGKLEGDKYVAPKVPITFLSGEALAPALDVRTYEPITPSLPISQNQPTWTEIDRARKRMLHAKTQSQAAPALYALGWLHLELGFDREGRYYLEQLSEMPGTLKASTVAMARARADLATGHWDEARERLREAWKAGAPESWVLESLALVSLATSNPPKAPTARALASSTGRPEALLLSAELLQRQGLYSESLPYIETIGDRIGPAYLPGLALRIGDARLMTGDYTGALNAYKSAEADMRGVRSIHANLLEVEISEWANQIPQLSAFASRGQGRPSAEALYLLSQLRMTLGEDSGAIEDLSRLIQFDRPYEVILSDVPDRLWALYARRIHAFHDRERWFKIAALHELVWSERMRNAIKDPHILEKVADAYEQLGLDDRALVVLRDAFSLLLARNQDSAELVFRLAGLYHRTDRPREGLDTLAYLEAKKLPDGMKWSVALLKANLYADLDDYDKAASFLRTAALHPPYREEAMLRLGMLEAESGQCARATAPLSRLLLPAQRRRRDIASRPYLALARCLLAQGRYDEAAQAAREAAGRSQSIEESRYAIYLTSKAEQTLERDPTVTASLLSGDDIWGKLGQEQIDAEKFERELERRR